MVVCLIFQDGYTPLRIASALGYIKVVKFLLAGGANPNLQGEVSGGIVTVF